MTSQKPILIAGAGISSLLLGRSLHRSRIPFLIFERDASIVFRAQGYRLRLSPQGLDAIEDVLGPEGFSKFYERCGKTGGGGLTTVDPLTGETLSEKSVSEQLVSRGNKVVGIARGDMRALFLEGMEENVRWSHHITGYEVGEEGVRAVFADGSKSVEGSLLVGGEGVKSGVARQLSGGKIKVYDLGARGIHGMYDGLRTGLSRHCDREFILYELR
jgi:2-polyprenyl-6-methoxyphenol hydroxylase-like FAD-dependent oxidoreductase